MQTATATKTKVPGTGTQPTEERFAINANTFLTKAGWIAAGSMEGDFVFPALDQMCEDAFLFGRKAEEDGLGYTFEEREYILYLQKEFKEIVRLLGAYNWCQGSEVVFSPGDYERLEKCMEDSFDIKEVIPVLEAMMITSIHFKWAVYGNAPSIATMRKEHTDIFRTYALLRDLIIGYIPKAERQD